MESNYTPIKKIKEKESKDLNTGYFVLLPSSSGWNHTCHVAVIGHDNGYSNSENFLFFLLGPLIEKCIHLILFDTHSGLRTKHNSFLQRKGQGKDKMKNSF